MQKKIIALAIASALTAPAAFADTSNVTVYGVANVSFDSVSNGNAAAVTGTRVNKVSSNVSRIGLKGSEDLGDGLSAIWQVEQQVNIDNSTTTTQGSGSTLATRNTFAGLSSTSYGTVLMGRHDTPYKIATRGLDVFGDSIADNRSLMGGVSASLSAVTAAATVSGASAGLSFDGRQTDVLAYISPAMSGFTGAVAYVAGAENATTSAQVKGNAWSLAGLYSNGPFFGSLAYEVHNVGTAGTGIAAAATPAAFASALAGLKESAYKFGFGYKQDAFEGNFAYEKTKDNFAGGAANLFGHNAWYLGGKYSFGSNAVKLAYTRAGDLGAAISTGASQVSLGFDHSLSKRTSVYAIYTQLSNKAAVNYGLSTAGSTGGQAAGTGLVGAKPSALSLGLKHTF